MGMKKGQKQYGEAFHLKVRKLRETGLTRRQISEEMNVEYDVIKEMFKRQNRDDRKRETNEVPKRRKGRPRVKPMTTLEELQKRNKELEMENELLKKFHEELRR
jgi:transposase